jgi:hypothetical protein
MKKKDAIKLIEEVILSFGPTTFSNPMAGKILMALRKAGVEPPMIRMSIPMGMVTWMAVHEWEEDAENMFDDEGYDWRPGKNRATIIKDEP